MKPEDRWNLLHPDVPGWLPETKFSSQLLINFSEICFAVEPSAAALAARAANPGDKNAPSSGARRPPSAGRTMSSLRTLRSTICRRIDAARRFVPIDKLVLSPQCGFSNTVHGSNLAISQEAEKLRLVVDVTRDVCGD